MAFDGPGRDAKRVREGCRAERRVRSQQPEELPAYSDIFSDIYSDIGAHRSHPERGSMTRDKPTLRWLRWLR